MTQEMTMGSLFSGSGGFELAASIFGFEPLWASEIEPLPMLVTRKNFPKCIQLGDINYIDGGEIEPVTVLSGGSPCQDMSIAGQRAGLGGSRSNLFHEQIRIVKEMREHDRKTGRTGKHIRPRYMVWENVPGAFSSNRGGDFQAVLQAIVSVTDETATVPLPPKRKWAEAGCIMGDSYSLAWRTLDAEYWGVPQRRKRIFLVADFGGSTAPQILFEREGLSRDFKESREAWAGIARGPEAGADQTVADGGAIVLENHPQDCRVTIAKDNLVPTLTEKMGTGGGNTPMIMERLEPIPIADKATRYKGGGEGRNDDGSANGLGVGEPGAPANTLTAADRHAVAYAMQAFGQYKESDIASTIKQRDYKDSTDLVVTEYIIRRLTPLECCRLQGFPDDWTKDIAIEEPSAATVREWMIAWAEWWRTTGRSEGIQLPKDKEQVKRWLKDPVSDSALYKMWGNGIALPCAMFVFEGIAEVLKKENSEVDTDGTDT